MPEMASLDTPSNAALTSCVELVGTSPSIERVHEFIRRAAALDSGLLLVAEDGCAVDDVASDVYRRSRRATAPFVAVDCSSDAAALERELFGASAGDGFDLEAVWPDSLIARARGGVLYLRNVGELPASVQARLARIARDGEVRVNGAPVETEVRFIASALPGVDADVDARRFRADLYRRLAAVRIDLPPLRDRREDITQIAVCSLEQVCEERRIEPRAFTPPALALIGGLSWPGNVRELREVIERVVNDCELPTIDLADLLPALRLQRASEPFAPAGSLREARLRFERDYIASVLQHHGWHMADAAQTLGIQRPNLYRKARQLGIPLTRVAE